MNTPLRLIAAALLLALGACGNKGPLVQADTADADTATAETAPAAEAGTPATSETTTTQPTAEPVVDETEPVPADAAAPPPAEDDGDP